jgi:hypothetical protein
MTLWPQTGINADVNRVVAGESAVLRRSLQGTMRKDVALALVLMVLPTPAAMAAWVA